MKKMVGLLALTLVVSCGKDDFLTQVGKDGERLVQNVGQAGELLGRTPRIIGNDILGTDTDSDDDIDSLEQDVREIYETIALMQQQIDDDISDLRSDMEAGDADLADAIDNLQDELEAEIRAVNRKNRKAIRKLYNKLYRLKRSVRSIRRNLNNLEVVCDYLDLGFIQLATYCELD